MKRRFVCACMAATLLIPQIAGAVDDTSAALTGDQIEYIRNNCGDTQTALAGLRSTDKVAYINIGEQLDIFSNRLMAPMNSRIALNKLDGVVPTKITVSFNDEITNFKSLYRTYEQSIATTAGMSCYNQPVEFYDSLTTTLQDRKAVRASVDKLTSYISEYRDAISALQKQAQGGSQS